MVPANKESLPGLPVRPPRSRPPSLPVCRRLGDARRSRALRLSGRAASPACQASRTRTDHQCQFVPSSLETAGCPSPAGLCRQRHFQCAELGTLVTNTSDTRVGEPGRSLSLGPSKCFLSLGSRARPLTRLPGDQSCPQVSTKARRRGRPGLQETVGRDLVPERPSGEKRLCCVPGCSASSLSAGAAEGAGPPPCSTQRDLPSRLRLQVCLCLVPASGESSLVGTTAPRMHSAGRACTSCRTPAARCKHFPALGRKQP